MITTHTIYKVNGEGTMITTHTIYKVNGESFNSRKSMLVELSYQAMIRVLERKAQRVVEDYIIAETFNTTECNCAACYDNKTVAAQAMIEEADYIERKVFNSIRMLLSRERYERRLSRVLDNAGI